MKPHVTTNPETLARNLAGAYAKGARGFYVHNKLPPGSAPNRVVDREYGEHDNFIADDLAREIFDAIKSDSDLRGGTNSYDISACNDLGASLNTWSITIKTNREGAEGVAGLSASDAHALRVVESFFGKYAGHTDKIIERQDAIIERVMSQNEKLLEKHLAGVAVIETSLSQQADRELRKVESEHTLKMQEESLKAIMGFIIPVMAQKMGVSESVVSAMMMQSAAQAEPKDGDAPPFQKKFLAVLDVLQSLTPEQSKIIFDTLTEEQVEKLKKAITV